MGAKRTLGIMVLWKRLSYGLIEFFYGIDIDNMDDLPEKSTVYSVWPPKDGSKPVEYEVITCAHRVSDEEVHLFVEYGEERPKGFPESYAPSRNTIVLKKGERSGSCCWQPSGSLSTEHLEWKSFDLKASHERVEKRKKYSGRSSAFRNMILSLDGSRCVLSCEKTEHALEVAHLIPARKGDNDIPSNGIALRADLHKLFDAGLFRFDRDGKVRLAEGTDISDSYQDFLKNKCLPDGARDRVKDTLAILAD